MTFSSVYKLTQFEQLLHMLFKRAEEKKEERSRQEKMARISYGGGNNPLMNTMTTFNTSIDTSLDDGKSRPGTGRSDNGNGESNMLKEIREMEEKLKLSQIPDVPTLEELKAKKGNRSIKTKAETDKIKQLKIQPEPIEETKNPKEKL